MTTTCLHSHVNKEHLNQRQLACVLCPSIIDGQECTMMIITDSNLHTALLV